MTNFVFKKQVENYLAIEREEFDIRGYFFYRYQSKLDKPAENSFQLIQEKIIV